MKVKKGLCDFHTANGPEATRNGNISSTVSDRDTLSVTGHHQVVVPKEVDLFSGNKKRAMEDEREFKVDRGVLRIEDEISQLNSLRSQLFKKNQGGA